MSNIAKRLRDKCDRKFINALCEEAAAELDRMEAALKLARSMFLDLERGIAPSRTDFNKIEAALAGKEGPTLAVGREDHPLYADLRAGKEG